MNYRTITYILGRIFIVIGALTLIPIIVAVIYRENTFFAFFIPAAAAIALGITMSFKKPAKVEIHAREGLVIAGLTWLSMSLFGAFPYLISGQITSFIDCIFESVSGFSTTGASILEDVEALKYSILFFRSFSQFVGGMGVLVFVLAILPTANMRGMHLFKAEVTGQNKSKFVSKTRTTAIVLYSIYAALTLLEFAFLVFKMPAFDSICHAMSTAGTGGFSIKNASISHYNSGYIDGVITVFMFLFGINFNIFFLIIMGSFVSALKNEELRWYVIIVFTVFAAITIDLLVRNTYSFGEALKFSSFQTISTITTTGFVATADIGVWSGFCRILLVLLMISGASSCSTGGGVKISRIVIAFKMCAKEIKVMNHPKIVANVRFDGKTVDEQTQRGIVVFFFCYAMIFIAALLLLSFGEFGFAANASAVISCLSNVGPAAQTHLVQNFADFSALSKTALSFCMIFGRLDIFPILILFFRSTWKRV